MIDEKEFRKLVGLWVVTLSKLNTSLASSFSDDFMGLIPSKTSLKRPTKQGA